MTQKALFVTHLLDFISMKPSHKKPSADGNNSPTNQVINHMLP
jgi:hypothetical protein